MGLAGGRSWGGGGGVFGEVQVCVAEQAQLSPVDLICVSNK